MLLRLLRSLVLRLTDKASGASAEEWCTNRLFAASFACINIAIVELVFSQFPQAKRALLIPYVILLLLFLVILGLQVLPRLVMLSIDSIRSLRVSSEVPLCLAVAVLFISGVYAPLSAVLVGSGLHYAESTVLVFLLLAFTDCFTLKSIRLLEEQAVFSIPELVKGAKRVNIDDPGDSPFVPAGQIKARDRLIVEKGGIIPADALVVGGSADIIERRLTFAAARRFKKAGDTVYAGSEVIKGSLNLQALASPSQSDLSACMDQINSSINSQNPFLARLVRTETALNIVCIAAGVGAGLYWIGAEASFLAVSSVVITALLVSLFSRTLPVLWEMLRAVSSATARLGVYCANIIATFTKLAAVRNLIVDFFPDEPAGQYALSSLSLLDERVSEKAVYSVLLSLFSVSDRPFHRDLAASIEKCARECSADEAAAWAEIEDSGVAGTVQGTRFLAGTEGALLAEGVRFEVDMNSAEPEDEIIFFLACGALPVARFSIQKPFRSDGPVLIKDLEKAGVHTLLAGSTSAEQLDAIGKKAGLELHAIAGGLDTVSFKEKIEGAKPAALVAGPVTKREIMDAASVTFSRFDEHAWNFNASDIVLFGRSLRTVLLAVRSAKAWHETWRILTLGSIAIGAVSLVFGMARIMHPLELSFILAVWSTAGYVLMVRLLRQVSPARLQ